MEKGNAFLACLFFIIPTIAYCQTSLPTDDYFTQGKRFLLDGESKKALPYLIDVSWKF